MMSFCYVLPIPTTKVEILHLVMHNNWKQLCLILFTTSIILLVFRSQWFFPDMKELLKVSVFHKIRIRYQLTTFTQYRLICIETEIREQISIWTFSSMAWSNTIRKSCRRFLFNHQNNWLKDWFDFFII